MMIMNVCVVGDVENIKYIKWSSSCNGEDVYECLTNIICVAGDVENIWKQAAE